MEPEVGFPFPCCSARILTLCSHHADEISTQEKRLALWDPRTGRAPRALSVSEEAGACPCDQGEGQRG